MIRGINTKSRIKESEVAMKKRFKFDDDEIRILVRDPEFTRTYPDMAARMRRILAGEENGY